MGRGTCLAVEHHTQAIGSHALYFLERGGRRRVKSLRHVCAQCLAQRARQGSVPGLRKAEHDPQWG